MQFRKTSEVTQWSSYNNKLPFVFHLGAPTRPHHKTTKEKPREGYQAVPKLFFTKLYDKSGSHLSDTPRCKSCVHLVKSYFCYVGERRFSVAFLVCPPRGRKQTKQLHIIELFSIVNQCFFSIICLD